MRLRNPPVPILEGYVKAEGETNANEESEERQRARNELLSAILLKHNREGL